MSLALIKSSDRAIGDRATEFEITEAINAFQSDTAEIESQREPMLLRATLYVLTAFIVGVIIWASLARIDRVVAARGKLISTENSIILQPIETSVLKSITVKPGDVVKAGQVLATLDPTFTEADVGQISVRMQMLEAQIARLEAELSGRPYEPSAMLPPEVALAQSSLWRNRQGHFQAQVASFDERIARTNAMVVSNKRQADFLQAQLNSWKEIERIRETLAANQVGSKLNALSATAGRLDVERNLAAAVANTKESEHELDDLKAQREVFIRQWTSQTTQDLVQQRTERNGLAEQLQKAKRRQQMVTISAPVDAVVLEVANRSVNSVIREAETLFTLVPVNAPLEVLAQIDGGEIGFVREGDPVHIKFDAYNFLEHGMAEGVVLKISEDSFAARGDQTTGPNAMATTDQNGGVARSGSGLFYRARIQITNVDLRNVPANYQLLPGLPLVADIKVGERSIISYFLRPLMGGMRESMREP